MMPVLLEDGDNGAGEVSMAAIVAAGLKAKALEGLHPKSYTIEEAYKKLFGDDED